MLFAGLLPVDHAHLAGHDAETGVQAGDAVVGRAQILVGQGAHQQLVEIIVRFAEIINAVRVMHQLGKRGQLLLRDLAAISTQGIGLHQQTHLKHAVHVFFGDTGHHQALFGQDGNEALLLQPAQRVPHGGAADVAHLGAELLLVEKLVGTVLAVQDFGFQVLVRLKFQAQLCLGFHLFHLLLLYLRGSFKQKYPAHPQRSNRKQRSGYGRLYP